ncbi:MAG: pyridoxal phosphate-dependent aminotransferase, partial [Dehalococcoidia bacterium]
ADGMMVSGAGGAVFLGLAGYVRHGTPVVVERPAYGAFERGVQFLGGVPVLYERREEEGWRFDPERLDALLVESGARVVGITDPHNPTGASIDTQTRRDVVEVAERHGALLLVDETFAPFRGAERAAAWCTTSDRVLTLGSLTKGWGLHALRAGWLLGAPGLVAPCAQAFDLVGGNPPSATLALARGALTFAETLDERARQASLSVHTAFTGAGWGDGSMLGSCDGIIGFLRLPAGWDSERAARLLREQDGVQVVPGHFFGRDDHVRIGFDPERTDGAEGCRLIRERLSRIRDRTVAVADP